MLVPFSHDRRLVTKDIVNDPLIFTRFGQVAGNRVSEDVRGQSLELGLLEKPAQSLTENVGPELGAIFVEKHPLLAAGLEFLGLQDGQQLFTDGDASYLFPLCA